MNEICIKSLNKELNLAAEAMKRNENQTVWNHLGRAHIISQSFPIQHLKCHFLMFVFACKTYHLGEILGQIPRMLLAIPGSLLKRAPRGNTGLSNVGIFTPMPIPEDLKSIVDQGKG